MDTGRKYSCDIDSGIGATYRYLLAVLISANVSISRKNGHTALILKVLLIVLWLMNLIG